VKVSVRVESLGLPANPTVNLAKVCERLRRRRACAGGRRYRVDVTKHDAARRAAFEVVEEVAGKRAATGCDRPLLERSAFG